MDKTTLLLSQEELLFALQAADESLLPGMGGLGLEQAEPPLSDALAQAGGRALMARGLITAGDAGRLTLDRGVYSLVTVCAHPQQMVSVFASGTHVLPHQAFYYRVDELAVTHTPRAYGLHQFEIAATSDLGAGDVAWLLESLPPSERLSAEQTLPHEGLLRAQVLAPQDRPAATAALVAAGLAPLDADAFAQTLGAVTVMLVIQLIYRFSPTVDQSVVKLVAGPGGCWLVCGERIAAEMVRVGACSSASAHAQLLQQFGPLNTGAQRLTEPTPVR